MGRTAALEDIEGVKKGCEDVYKAQGGIGKFLIEMDGKKKAEEEA